MVDPGGPTSPSGVVGPRGTTRPTPGRRSRRPVVAGVLAVTALGAAIVVAIVLWAAADQRYADNVASFARAPVGCDTTLEFESAGEYVLYLETSGRIGELRGDCDLAEAYDRASDGLPRPVLALRAAGEDPDGDQEGGDTVIDLGPTAGVDYDTGGYVGTAYRLVDVPAAGDYVLTVDDDADEPYAIAVGRDPAAGVPALRWGALASVLAGFVVAGLALVVASRRPRTPPASPSGWAPVDQPPVASPPWTTGVATFPGSPNPGEWPTAPPGWSAPSHPDHRPPAAPSPAWPPTAGAVPPWAPPAPHGEREW